MAHDETLRAAGKCAFIKADGTPCKCVAGSGTPHKGQGCCRIHGGNGGRAPSTGKYIGEGKYKRYDVLKSPDLRELQEHFELDADPLNLLPEVILLRTVLTHFANNYTEMVEGLLAWHASFDADARKAERLYFAQWVADLKAAVRAEMNCEDDRHVDEILEDTKLPDRPYPLDHNPRPRRVVDLIQVGKFIVDVGTLAEKIEKARQNQSVSLLEVNEHWKLIGFEFVRGVRECVKDEDLCAKLIGNVQGRWDNLPVLGVVKK